MWMYHSHYDESPDIQAGLYGPLIIYNKGVLDSTTGLPKDVDREFVLLYLVRFTPRVIAVRCVYALHS
jgi:hypothetical protein